MSSPLYFVYVIQNAAGRFYVGLTENLAVRVNQHNEGMSVWTRGKGPWKLVWTSSQLSLSAARRLEKRIKCQKGGVGFYRMTGITDSIAGS